MRRNTNKATHVVPRLKGFDDQHRKTTIQNQPFKKAPTILNDLKVPNSVRHNNNSIMPASGIEDTIDRQERLRPAPLITGREALLDSSKECGESSPSGYRDEIVMQRVAKG